VAFDKFKSYWNMDVKDGVRGQAVIQSLTYPTEPGTSSNARMWLDIYVEGWEPYRLKHHCQVKHTKYPSVGDTLPVMVAKDNRERISVLWDEVKTVDELMSEGRPGDAPGAVSITMGEPQVINLDEGAIDLSGAGLSGDLNDQIQQAMQLAQQAMQDAPPASAGPANMVEDRIAKLERLARLRDAGALSDAEFEAEKARVLAGG
jgi:hypothetical protein